MKRFGLVRVATISPKVAVADCRRNADEILRWLKQAAYHEIDLVVFPELSLTGYTCGDLFAQRTLLESAEAELARVVSAAVEVYRGLVVVGMPVGVGNATYNVAAIAQGGRLLGLVPKTFIPNYREFYELRWFAPAERAQAKSIGFAGQEVPFGTDLLFRADSMVECVVGVEICEDLWTPLPPSGRQALAGATVLVNLSASNECTGKAEYRRDLVVNQSARCVAAYVYAAAGVAESTTDLVFGGHGMVAENGQLLCESPRFARRPELLLTDVDVERLVHDRRTINSFADGLAPTAPFRVIDFALAERSPPSLPARPIPAHPFVPPIGPRLDERCREIFSTQIAGLAKRIETVRPPCLRIGVSGGLDSTLALLAVVKTCDLLQLPRTTIEAVTMPGFGTTKRTRHNADKLMDALDVRALTIDIREVCLRTFCDLKHSPFGIDVKGLSVADFEAAVARVPAEQRRDLVFENVQARMRTLLLMAGGFTVGTGDLSELALGWCTYNGDHMSMYNPNVGIPKTLVRQLVRWAAENEFEGEIRAVLEDIVATIISPELLPVSAAGEAQSTESTLGPYEVLDFFLYHMLRFGFSPAKIAYLAGHAKFDREYRADDIRDWLIGFYRRFFANQFKRSCLPDGPKIGSISLSPRGDWRMPSDAEAATWLQEAEQALRG